MTTGDQGRRRASSREAEATFTEAEPDFKAARPGLVTTWARLNFHKVGHKVR